MKKIILFQGGVETLDFFSARLAEAFRVLGHSCFIFTLEDEKKNIPELISFMEHGDTVLVTFNFHGLDREAVFYDEKKRLLWDVYLIPCINIIVDHPFYYHSQLSSLPVRYRQFCIDRYHLAYMRRFYPHIALGPYLPSAGTPLLQVPKPVQERKMDIIFTGNYTKPETFNRHITRLGPEYELFYRAITADLISHPARPIEQVMEEHMLREMGSLPETELCAGMASLIFLDLYVRFYFRGQIIAALADNGLNVHVFGSGWDTLPCKHPENLLIHGAMDSLGCLKAINDAKISLNIMPYFKDGAHDRIFNSMLGGAVCVTDSSFYLEETFQSGDSLCYFCLEKIADLPDQISALLSDAPRMQSIAHNGFEKASAGHTWSHRAALLSHYAEQQ